MVKSKSEMMHRLYHQRKDEGLVRVSFWVPKDTRQNVVDAVERVLDGCRVNKERGLWK